MNDASGALTLIADLTCPYCGATVRESMPVNACVHRYDCPACHRSLRPRPGDCCVFCSYGSVRCPPEQLIAKPHQG